MSFTLGLRPTRKLNWEALRRDVQENPDALLRERAERFGVEINAIWYALQKKKQTCKKTLLYEQRKPGERIYLSLNGGHCYIKSGNLYR